MSNYTVSARKYRPQRFSDVVGQEAVTTTLRNAIKTGKLAHAYLFAGPRGVGKTTCARIFAKTINCEHPTPEGEACNQCPSCIAFNEGRSFNIHELDAASNNSVEDIRKLIEQVRIPPQMGKYNVYIIDEVHMLSQAAFNAFLKTLEEPPKHAIFIMATTEKHKILPTILSRCQVFDFQRIKIGDIVNHLKKIAEKENIEAEDDALNIIAQKADGALRDALSIFDQLVSFTQGKLTYQAVIKHLNVLDYDYYFKLTDNFLKGNYQDNLLIFDEILQKGFDPQHFLNGLAEHFRNLLVVRTPKTLNLLEVGQSIKQRYKQQVKNTPIKFLLKALDVINYFDVNYKTAKNKRLHVELALIKLSELSQKIYEQEASEHAKQPEHHTSTKQNESGQQAGAEQPLSEKIRQKAANVTFTKNTQPQQNISIKELSNNSINKLLKSDEQQDTTKTAKSDEPAVKHVNTQTIKQLLHEFASLKLKDKVRLQNILKNYPPGLENNVITITVVNQLQQREVLKIKQQILSFIQAKTGQKFELKAEVKQVKVERKPLTPNEKYEYLRKKNPKLDDFTKLFDLEIDS